MDGGYIPGTRGKEEKKKKKTRARSTAEPRVTRVGHSLALSSERESSTVGTSPLSLVSRFFLFQGQFLCRKAGISGVPNPHAERTEIPSFRHFLLLFLLLLLEGAKEISKEIAKVFPLLEHLFTLRRDRSSSSACIWVSDVSVLPRSSPLYCETLPAVSPS